jgi:hypothetical protein
LEKEIAVDLSTMVKVVNVESSAQKTPVSK